MDCLFNLLLPVCTNDPLFEKPFIEAVAFGLSQEVIQKIEKIRVALVDSPGQRFVGERIAQKNGLALALAAVKKPDER